MHAVIFLRDVLDDSRSLPPEWALGYLCTRGRPTLPPFSILHPGHGDTLLDVPPTAAPLPGGLKKPDVTRFGVSIDTRGDDPREYRRRW